MTQALTVPEAIAHRSSIRQFEAGSLTDAEVHELLGLAIQAPSAFNFQPWRFVAVRDPAVKAQLRGAAFGQAQVEGAQLLVVLYTDMADALAHLDEIVHPGLPPEQREPTKQRLAASFASKSAEEAEAWGAEQSYIALGYLLLAAESLGYGTSPMLGFNPAQVKEILGLPATSRVPALIAIGRPAAPGFSRHRHPIERVVRFV